MDKNKLLGKRRTRRQYHVRNAIHGTAERPRLSVFRSHQNISCQIIDDEARKTLVAASTSDADLRADVGYGGNKVAAEKIGKIVAERALAAGIKQVCFDRGHFRYHGRIAAVADAARAAGLSL